MNIPPSLPSPIETNVSLQGVASSKPTSPSGCELYVRHLPDSLPQGPGVYSDSTRWVNMVIKLKGPIITSLFSVSLLVSEEGPITQGDGSPVVQVVMKSSGSGEKVR